VNTGVLTYGAKRADNSMTTVAYRRVNRQYVAMTTAEVWEFVDSQRVAFVAFVDRDMYPHVTPVWYVSIAGTLYFRATSNKVKAKLADNARVCCTFADGERFTELRGVVIRGRSRLLNDPALIERCSELLDKKYAGLRSRDLDVPDRWLAARDLDSSSMVAVAPERISSWDNSKLDAWNP
jgi:nitroimidazol reductase NimA-like FMN-containing flavoprotein (pyridoxamine 5'-phosphate oxidase superfamily)